MPAGSGRLERRIRLAVPVEVSSPQNPSAAERTTTENVCSLGIRVLSQRAKELNERLLVSSIVGILGTVRRVAYCQRLPEGRFGMGFQFHLRAASWPRKPLPGWAI